MNSIVTDHKPFEQSNIQAWRERNYRTQIEATVIEARISRWHWIVALAGVTLALIARWR